MTVLQGSQEASELAQTAQALRDATGRIDKARAEEQQCADARNFAGAQEKSQEGEQAIWERRHQRHHVGRRRRVHR